MGHVPKTHVNPALKIVQDNADMRKQLTSVGYRVVMLREVAIGTLTKLQQTKRLTPEIAGSLSIQIDTFLIVLNRCMGMPEEVYENFKKMIDPKQLEKEVEKLCDRIAPVLFIPSMGISRPGGGKFHIS